MASVKKQKTASVGKQVEKLEAGCIAKGNVNFIIKTGISKQLDRQLTQEMEVGRVKRNPISVHTP